MIILNLRQSVLLLSILNCFEVRALDWPWEKTHEKEQPTGFSADQVKDRSVVNQTEIKKQVSSGQKGTIVYSSIGETYVDFYDDKGVPHRINLDINGDGKIGSEDFLLSNHPNTAKEAKEQKSQETKIHYNPSSAKPDFLKQLYAGKMQQEIDEVTREVSFLENEVHQISQEILPAIDRTQMKLRDAILGFEETLSRIDQQLLRYGVEIQKENGENERIKIPLNSPEASTIRRILLERRQILIQTMKLRDLIQTQETYRLGYMERKGQLEIELEITKAHLRKIEEDKEKL